MWVLYFDLHEQDIGIHRSSEMFRGTSGFGSRCGRCNSEEIRVAVKHSNDQALDPSAVFFTFIQLAEFV